MPVYKIAFAMSRCVTKGAIKRRADVPPRIPGHVVNVHVAATFRAVVAVPADERHRQPKQGKARVS